MKKIISIILILGTILSFVGCSDASIEEQIVSNGKQSLQGFTPERDTITIQRKNSDIVIATSHGERTYSIVAEGDENGTSLTNIQEITSSDILETVSSSKELLINYINESIILTDKEDLISYINGLPVKLANFPNNSIIAGFDPTADTVFINAESNLLDTHTIVHELFHALSNKTRINSNWYENSTTLFDEAFTELLASSVIKPNYPTVYDNYIKYVYHFIGSQELEAIRTYFYGVDEEKIHTVDFYLYTLVVECLNESETETDIESEKLTLYLILSKWGLEKK